MPIAPLAYVPGQGGFSSIGKRTGELTGISAGDVLARFRWPLNVGKAVLLRIRAAIDVSSGLSNMVQMALQGRKVTGFSADFTTNLTSADLQSLPGTGLRSRIMGPSMMANAGPGVATTAGMTGATLVKDTDPFVITPIGLFLPVSLAGAYVGNPVQPGACSGLITLYEWAGNGDHPIVLSGNDGVLIESHFNGPGSGTFGLYTVWDWAENVQGF